MLFHTRNQKSVMCKWFLLLQKRRSCRSSSNALRILLPWPFRSNYWPDDHFNMNNWGGINSTVSCSTQETYNQSCWSDFFCSRSVETIDPPAMHQEFYFYDNSEAPADQTITSTWATVVGLSRQWPVPHKKATISHVEVISLVAEVLKRSIIQHFIENFT